MHDHELLFAILFTVVVLALVAIDLAIFYRRPDAVRFREALVWSAIWVSLAVLFAVGLYFWWGRQSALEFSAGYLVEASLSVDNLFVFLVIFRYFRVDPVHQHKVLFWGIVGALVMRALFILVGLALVKRFHWVFYIFGAWLVYTGIHLAFKRESPDKPGENVLVHWFRRIMPITEDASEGRFFVRRDGLYATPLFLVLLVVETTDVLFATDSIPAILAITRDPFIVYTSNVFAVLGLRSLYFTLAGMMQLFAHLHYGLSAILVFVGVKMLISSFVDIPSWVALVTVATILAASIVLSLMFPPDKKVTAPNP